MSKLWSKLNRLRGGGHKTLGIFLMWLILQILCQPSIYFRPEVFGLENITQMVVFSIGSTLALLCQYRFFWGSAAWHQTRDTSDEDLLWFAKRIAERETNIIYRKSTSNEDALRYKDAAFTAVCVFRYYLGYAILSIATLNPLFIILGKRGKEVADIYIDEFTYRHDSDVLKRSEERTGDGDANYIIVFICGLAIQSIILLNLI